MPSLLRLSQPNLDSLDRHSRYASNQRAKSYLVDHRARKNGPAVLETDTAIALYLFVVFRSKASHHLSALPADILKIESESSDLDIDLVPLTFCTKMGHAGSKHSHLGPPDRHSPRRSKDNPAEPSEHALGDPEFQSTERHYIHPSITANADDDPLLPFHNAEISTALETISSKMLQATVSDLRALRSVRPRDFEDWSNRVDIADSWPFDSVQTFRLRNLQDLQIEVEVEEKLRQEVARASVSHWMGLYFDKLRRQHRLLRRYSSDFNDRSQKSTLLPVATPTLPVPTKTVVYEREKALPCHVILRSLLVRFQLPVNQSRALKWMDWTSHRDMMSDLSQLGCFELTNPAGDEPWGRTYYIDRKGNPTPFSPPLHPAEVARFYIPYDPFEDPLASSPREGSSSSLFRRPPFPHLHQARQAHRTRDPSPGSIDIKSFPPMDFYSITLWRTRVLLANDFQGLVSTERTDAMPKLGTLKSGSKRDWLLEDARMEDELYEGESHLQQSPNELVQVMAKPITSFSCLLLPTFSPSPNTHRVAREKWRFFRHELRSELHSI